MAKRYQPSELIGEQGGVQTFSGRDVVNGLPVRIYSFVGEPTLKEGELRSDFIPPVLSSSFTGLAGEVVSAFADEFRGVKGAVAPGQVEALLRETAAAMDDAAKVGVVHGDLSPERVFFDREGGVGGRFLFEGYGVPWPVRPSEFSAPERIGGASFAGDIFSWARTVKHLSGPLPGELRDLLDRCLRADPAARPQAREVRSALERYPFDSSKPKPNPQAHRDTSAFERYAEYDYTEADTDDGRDGLRELGLALPPKTFKLKEYQRQQTVKQPPAALKLEPDHPEAMPEALNPTSNPSAPTKMPSTVPSSKVRRVSGVSNSQHAPDSLGQLDATEAYRARLAAYQAKRGAQNGEVSRTTSQSPSSVSEAPVPATPVPAARPEVARAPLQGETSRQETAKATGPERPPPRVRVQHLPDPNDAARTEKNSSRDSSDDFDPDSFEVIDDIRDDAPDPTLYRGGRRVFLLTLLGIALLVLLALQIINA